MARVHKISLTKLIYVKTKFNFKYELRNFIFLARGGKCGDMDEDINLIITKTELYWKRDINVFNIDREIKLQKGL